jgi:hypothetical protein
MKFRRVRQSEVTTKGLCRLCWPPIVALVAAVLCVGGVLGCSSGGNRGDQTTSTSGSSPAAGDIVGAVGDAIQVEDAVLTVRAFEVAFQPAMPIQRLSDETPTAPGAGEGFYQAYVRIENDGLTPLRVDPEDFLCAVGTMVATIEPTRSGPIARSLIEGTSLDLLLTFKAPTGYSPVLLYSPPWYDGVIRVSPGSATPTTSTT